MNFSCPFIQSNNYISSSVKLIEITRVMFQKFEEGHAILDTTAIFATIYFLFDIYLLFSKKYQLYKVSFRV